MQTTVKIFTFNCPSAGNRNVTFGKYRDIRFPCIGRQTIILLDGEVKSSERSIATKGVKVALIQVEPGKRVLIEINSPSDVSEGKPADDNSMWLEGDQVVDFGEHWTISVKQVGETLLVPSPAPKHVDFNDVYAAVTNPQES